MVHNPHELNIHATDVGLEVGPVHSELAAIVGGDGAGISVGDEALDDHEHR